MAEVIFWIICGIVSLGFFLFSFTQEQDLYVPVDSIKRWENGGKHL